MQYAFKESQRLRILAPRYTAAPMTAAPMSVDAVKMKKIFQGGDREV